VNACSDRKDKGSQGKLRCGGEGKDARPHKPIWVGIDYLQEIPLEGIKWGDSRGGRMPINKSAKIGQSGVARK